MPDQAGAFKMLIDQPTKLELFNKITRIRTVEEKLAVYYHEQQMRCPTHFSIGQEAVAVGITAALRPQDTVMSNHRSHAHYLAKGGNLDRMVAELYGKATGCSKGKGGSMHLVDWEAGFMGATSIVSGTIPVSCGIGFFNKLKNLDAISTVFIGDASTEEGVFYETVNFAALHDLPVLFVCENNLYSVYTPLNLRQPEQRKIHKVVQAMGIDSLEIDGNDVEEVYLAGKNAVEKITTEKKPFFIEAHTYRWLEHCGPNFDNDLGYRSSDEFECWKMRDPLALYERQLRLEGLLTDDHVASIKAACQKEIDDAVTLAKNAPWPSAEEAFEGVYA